MELSGYHFLVTFPRPVAQLSLSMGISEEIEDAKITAEKTKISKLKGRSENYPKFA